MKSLFKDKKNRRSTPPRDEESTQPYVATSDDTDRKGIHPIQSTDPQQVLPGIEPGSSRELAMEGAKRKSAYEIYGRGLIGSAVGNGNVAGSSSQDSEPSAFRFFASFNLSDRRRCVR